MPRPEQPLLKTRRHLRRPLPPVRRQ